jgi:hypothetical protein
VCVNTGMHTDQPVSLLRSSWHGLRCEPPDFYGNDSRELYAHNLQHQPADWPWRTAPVRYTVNSQGYRAPEFDSVDWPNSVLMFGCSYQFAPGVDDSQTMTAHVAGHLRSPVVNLGQGATDPLFQWANSNILYAAGVRPRAVVYLWPGMHRLTEFVGSGSVRNWGPWNAHMSTLASGWITHETHIREYLNFVSLSVRNLWSCPVIEHYAYNYGPAAWGTIGAWGCVADAARDVGLDGAYHPGPATLRAWAHSLVIPALAAAGIVPV